MFIIIGYREFLEYNLVIKYRSEQNQINIDIVPNVVYNNRKEKNS